MSKQSRQALDLLLDESILSARARESAAFDELSNGDVRSIVIVGAGRLGKKLLRVLRGQAIEPLAFADNNQSLWHTSLDGVVVMSPADAAKKFAKSALFIVSIWNASASSGVVQILRQLDSLGCSRIAPFVWLMWKYPASLLPYYLWDLPSKLLSHRENILRAYESLTDDASKAEFESQVRFRLTGDFFCLNAPHPEKQYFPEDLYERSPQECFVDCGAYDGDTIETFLAFSSQKFLEVIAFEADPANYKELVRFYNQPKTEWQNHLLSTGLGVIYWQDPI